MATKAPAFNLLIHLLISVSFASAQSITPSTLNMGGGSYENGAYHFDWSIGEGTSIETFQVADNLMVTSGVLQPLTEKPHRLDNSTYPWFKDEIAIFPVPTHNILQVDIKIIENGQITMQLFDQKGLMIQTRTFDYLGTTSLQKLDLTSLTPGVYYLNVMLVAKPVFPIIRKSTFKIQKL